MYQKKMTERIYRKILNEHFDLIYVLDNQGNYVFANDAYLSMIQMTMTELAGCNVHDFMKQGIINICVSDEVYRTKKRVIMFQDLFLGDKGIPLRFIIISTPILDDNGDVSHIFAVMKSMEKLNDAYRLASKNAISSFKLQEEDDEIPPDIVAESPAMRNVLKIVQKVAKVNSSVLIEGESGTGKEVVASFLHRSSDRSDHPFVTINCASLPEALLESELFGYEKGAFTGAASAKKGLFQEADQGTLFLDEINSLPLSLQGKLLRAIETRTIQRIGSTKPVPVDFRLVAATNQDLHELCEQKMFRSDLYYRLNVIPIHLSPLRERKEDIIPLAEAFLSMYCQRFSRQVYMTSSTMEALRAYDWPGNVRELKNFMERAVILALDEYIDLTEVNPADHDPETDSGLPLPDQTPVMGQAGIPENDYNSMLENRVSLKDYLERCEKEYLEYVFQKESSTYKVAEMLDTSQSSIMRKKRKYGL